MKRALTALSLILWLCLSTVLPPLVCVSAQQTAPPSVSSKTLRLAGLRASVTVRRDERGIPYITAANEADLYFAQGYVTASERLWQMDILRRNARGELSEIFGERTLKEDQRHRLFGSAQLAEALL
ncbi:MAG: penicillin acylase family protein, partial [Pyrinomonadaceae bacterium]